MSDEIRIGDVERKYNACGEALADWIEACRDKGLSPEYTMTLLLDKGVDFALKLADSEAHGRQVVQEMVEEKAHARRKNNEQN